MKVYKIEVRNFPCAEITDYIIEDVFYFKNKDKAEAKYDELFKEYNTDYDTGEPIEQDEWEVALMEINIEE